MTEFALSARSGLVKTISAFFAALMLLLALFLVLCLVTAGPLAEAGGWFQRSCWLVADTLFRRFGLLAWALPLTCLLSALLIWRARAVNSLLPLWVGVSWSIICGAALLGETHITLAGTAMSWGGIIGQEMAMTLEIKLGGWVSFLLLFNLCLLGLALVCWAIMPVLWNWRKNPYPRVALLDERELLRQAVLQGVSDARQQIAQVVQVEVETMDLPAQDEAYDFAPIDNGQYEPMVDISIDNNPPDEPVIGPAPSGAYLRPIEGRQPQLGLSTPDTVTTHENAPPFPAGEQKPALESNPLQAIASLQSGNAGQISFAPENNAEMPPDFMADPMEEPVEEAAPYPTELPYEPPEQAPPVQYQQDADDQYLPVTLENTPPVHEAGPIILERQDTPIIDSGGTIAQAEKGYQLPPLDLLQPPPTRRSETQSNLLTENSRLLEEKLANFGVQGQVVEVAPGPVVTMYEFKPAPGVKISKVAGLSDDLAMNMKANSVRIVAPIPGKSVIGIEIPSPQREMVYLRELLASEVYRNSDSPLSVAMGKDIMGQPVVSDLARMPHLLIAGATGAGKSVFINTLVLSILYRATPAEVRLLMVDPKRIELSTYNHIPHLLYPIITQPKDATAGLRWAVAEMERRYDKLAEMGVRNIATYNQRIEQEHSDAEPLPYIVVIIDELADLMMVASKEVETLITRLAQMARASGIHLVLATQRPSVDVITGLIKANFPARLSFQVSSRIDSRTILDAQGAENLLGSGDMLFLPPGTAGLRRLHGAFVSDEEIEAVVEFVKQQAEPNYDESVVMSAQESENGEAGDEVDELYQDAISLVKQSGQASISNLQRRLRVGYNRAARMIEQMEMDGIVGPSDGSRPREVYVRDPVSGRTKG